MTFNIESVTGGLMFSLFDTMSRYTHYPELFMPLRIWVVRLDVLNLIVVTC